MQGESERRHSLTNQPVQVAPEVFKCTATMAELVLHNGGQFTKCLMIFRDQKHWVIAKTVGPFQRFNNPAPTLAARFQADIAVGVGHGKLADEGGTPFSGGNPRSSSSTLALLAASLPWLPAYRAE